MRLFNRSAKRRAAQGFAAPNNAQRAQTQTFILEPILTPSGLVDGGDDTPDLAVLDVDAAYSTDSGVVDINMDAGRVAPSDADLATDGDGFQEPISDDTSSTLNMDVDGGPDQGIEDFPDFDMDDKEIEPIAFIYQVDFEPVETLASEESLESFNFSSDFPLDSTEFDIEADAETDLSLDVDDAAQSNIDAEVTEQNVDPTTVTDADQTAEGLPDREANINIDLSVSEVVTPRFSFDSGVFTVGETGEVGIDFLFDGGRYQGELAIFSLEGMEQFEPGSEAFIQEAAHRALSDSELGHVVIRDRLEAAKFSGSLGESSNWNTGEYLGVKTFTMRPGDEFGIMLVPNGRVQTVLDNPAVNGAKLPLFSMATANPDDAFHVGQAVDVTGDGSTFVMEDQRVDKGSDRDYNDLIFQVRGATGKAASIDEYIAPTKDWRTSDLGHALIEYAKPYINPDIPIDPVIPDIEEPDPISSTADPDRLGIDTPDSDPPIDFDFGLSPEAQSSEVDSVALDVPLIPVTDIPPTDSSELSIPDTILTSAIATNDWKFSKEHQPLIGIIDTGFSANNPDINYSRLILGRDRIDGDANPLLLSGEGNEHGTHILGIIGATQDNGVGIDGINDDAPLWVGRAVGSGQWVDSLVEFVDAAKESGQPNAVVNLSLDLTQVNPDGSVTTRYEFTPAERAAIEYARQHNVLIVAAAGNDGGVMSVLGQASQEFDNIITVGAAERINDEVALFKAFDRAAYSSYGNGLDIMAPGGSIENPELSTTGDGVGAMAGTSIASAKVTGAVSQVWAANSSLSYRQVIEILKNSATDLKTPGWDGETGAGLLNIAAAVHLAKATKPEEYDVPATLIPETWSGEGRVTPTERAASTEFMGKYYEWESYTIRSGDTLSAIAYRTMGNGTASYYNFIAQRNGITNPNLIYPGRTIQVPREVSAPAPQPQPNLNNTVGYDGTSTHQTYINTFNRNGGSSALGFPSNNVHSWGDGYTQDFSGGSDGTGAIMKSNANDNSYWVGGDFWNTFLQFNSVNGLLKYPTSDRYGTNGGQRQDFQDSAILKSGRGIFPVYGGIGSHYLNNESGQNGRLGFPTSGEIGVGNGVIVQNFENGRIVYGDGPTRTEMNGQSQPQPQPIPQVPINDKSDNYRKGLVNPFAYNWIGQCTWYTYGRMLETGLLPAAIKANALFRGHAGTWKQDAERVGLPVTSTPTAGARGIVVWPPKVKGAGSVGHVAFLEEVYPDGRIRITEANWPTGSWIKERILTPAQYAGVSFVQLENARTNSYYAPPATPGQQRQYIVRPGDTLSGIAQRELGNANRWREIQKPGGGTFTEAEARRIQPGQSVYLPVSYQTGTGTPTPVTPAPVQPADFAKALAFVRRWEGGYVNHPSDPGGATNKGITQNTYNAYRAGKGLPARDVRLITDQEVQDIYYTRYWMPSGSNQLTSRLAMVHFDTAVNMGVGGASTLLQQARQSSSGDEMSVVRRYLDLREARYRAIVANNPRMGVFLQGWLNRLNALRREVEANSVSPPSSTPRVNSNINWVNFSGTVGPSIGVNLRNSPRFSDRSSRNEPYNKRLEFDAWTYGEVGTDMWTGQPDARWFKVKGTNFWVPSAYIYGNPPNSSPIPSGDDSGSDNSSSDDAIFVGSNPTLPPVAGTTFGKQARVGFVYPYLSLWDSPNKIHRLGYLGFNDILYVAKELPGGWYEVATIDGKVGYVDKNFVIIQHPEQGARLHRITSSETAIGIAEQYYKNLIKPGEDLRFFVNALAYANQGMAGIYYEGKQWKDVDWSNIDWTKVKVRADHNIWVPSGEFMQRLRGQVPSGSITGGLWANTVNWVNANVPDWAKFGAAFAGGVLHGATDSVLDIFRGLWDIGESVFNIIKSLVTGNILSDAQNLWDELSKVNWSDLLSDLSNNFQERWNDSDPWKSGHFRGWLLGYALAEIAVIVLTAGAGAVATGIKLTGKLSKLAKWLSKLPIIGKLIDKAADAGKTLKWFEQSSILRDAAKFKGNRGIPGASFTRKQADTLGHAWVGRSYQTASDGKTLISADGLRQYRPPSYKPNLNKTQANLEWRSSINDSFKSGGNTHLDISNP